MSRLARHVAAIFLLLSSSVGAQTATPEVPTPGLNDIAVVVAHPNSPTGAVILFNPSLCQQIGLACRFFAVHEHCHVLLGHHLNPGGNTMLKERDADRCAAQNAPPQAVMAAWTLFMNGGSSSDWHTYGPPQDRARRLCLFAAQTGNWSGPFPCP
ncbi:MAG: hypothetical protein ACU0CT_05130 [Paracoccaceae bacterium]|jgi:hypothetical protein